MNTAIRDPRQPPKAHRKIQRLPFDKMVKHRSILDALLSFPGRGLTVRELSRESGVSYSTTWRLVEDLKALGLLTARRVGNSWLVSVNPSSPLMPDLARIRSMRLSPHRDAAVAFARLVSGIKEVQKVILFGSVSKGQASVHSDIDIAMVLLGSSKRVMERLYGASLQVQDQTGLTIAPIKITMREFRSNAPFIQEVRKGEVLYERN